MKNIYFFNSVAQKGRTPSVAWNSELQIMSHCCFPSAKMLNSFHTIAPRIYLSKWHQHHFCWACCLLFISVVVALVISPGKTCFFSYLNPHTSSTFISIYPPFSFLDFNIFVGIVLIHSVHTIRVPYGKCTDIQRGF